MNVKKEIADRAEYFHRSVHGGLHALTVPELRRLRKAAAKLTGTNCWWAAHRMAPHLIREIDEMLAFRLLPKKRSAPNGKVKL